MFKIHYYCKKYKCNQLMRNLLLFLVASSPTYRTFLELRFVDWKQKLCSSNTSLGLLSFIERDCLSFVGLIFKMYLFEKHNAVWTSLCLILVKNNDVLIIESVIYSNIVKLIVGKFSRTVTNKLSLKQNKTCWVMC